MENIKVNIFINKAKLTHEDKYDYSLVDYINSYTKVRIICPIHGEFEQRVDIHLSVSGCQKCARERQNINVKSTNDIFINNANQIHGGKYDYSNINYINARTKVKIICPIHGEFEQ